MSRNCTCNVLLLTMLTAGFFAEVSAAGSDLVSNQKVVAFLTETIDWYRHRAIERQIATEPGDLVFMEDNRPIAAQIVRLSLDFARADASIAAMSAAGNQKASAASGFSPDLVHFVQLESSTELSVRQASQEIEAIRKKLLSAHGAERRNLQAALDATQSRLDVLQAGLASLRDVVEFVRAAGGWQTGDLESRIEDFARSVPDITNPALVGSQTRNSDIPSLAKRRGSSILDLSAEVSALGNKVSILDDEIGRTEKLRQSADDLHTPLLAYINKHFPTGEDNYLQASDLRILQQQKAQLDALKIMVKALAPAMVALDKRNVLLVAYSSHLKSWRAAVVSEDKKAWKALISRLVSVALVVGALLVTGAVARRATDRHVRDVERRHIIRVIQRVVLWFTIVLVIAFSFASDLTSLATFFGLLTAGVAVALQSVILAALGYFVLVGRRGIRIGDRVEISGVTGDVTDIDWLQFQLTEIDNQTQQRTGRVVTFSNSFVFASPATGLSKLNREGSKPAAPEVSEQRRQ